MTREISSLFCSSTHGYDGLCLKKTVFEVNDSMSSVSEKFSPASQTPLSHCWHHQSHDVIHVRERGLFCCNFPSLFSIGCYNRKVCLHCLNISVICLAIRELLFTSFSIQSYMACSHAFIMVFAPTSYLYCPVSSFSFTSLRFGILN